MPDQCVIDGKITVAAGVFAPGHLGELTQVIDFELVDAVAAETGTVQRRVRRLPTRVVIYFVLALALFAQCGYLRVWDKLTASLSPLRLAPVSAKALSKARRRVGPRPLRRLFEVLAGPVARPGTTAAFWRGHRIVIIDGTLLAVPDDPAVTGTYRKRSGKTLTWGYPQARLVALIECGTRAVLTAVFGPETGKGNGEQSYARQLLATGALTVGMLLLADTGFDAAALLAAVQATGAGYLIRSGASRTPLIVRELSDGSYLSIIATSAGPMKVRIVEALVTITTSDDTTTEQWRLITSLLDCHRYPATELVALYHQRWQVETAYYTFKHTILDRRVLRSHRPDDIDQEIHALLCVYQALIRIGVDAADHARVDPDRISFTVLLETARNLVITATGVLPATIELVGQIGKAALANLLAKRRPRTKARCRKVATSKYAANSGRSPTTHRYTINTNIEIFEQPLTARRRP